MAVAATLNQADRLVTFFSRSFTPTERKHASAEKEVCAIIEAVKKWSHYLSERKFTIVTDQHALNFMFQAKRLGTNFKITKSNGGRCVKKGKSS